MQKVYSCHTSLGLLDDIPDARIIFHIHRVTGSVCRVEHVFRLTPPELSLAAAQKFDDLQMSAYSCLNDVPVSPSIATQIRLPLSLGGHGFTALSPFVYASHAASLIESATVPVKGPDNPSEPFYRIMARRFLVHVIGAMNPEVRTRGIFGTHSSLGPFEPEALLSRPERVHKTLFQALHGFSSRIYWETTSWENHPRPRDHSALSICRRVRYNSLRVPGASSFLCAHPALTSRGGHF